MQMWAPTGGDRRYAIELVAVGVVLGLLVGIGLDVFAHRGADSEAPLAQGTVVSRATPEPTSEPTAEPEASEPPATEAAAETAVLSQRLIPSSVSQPPSAGLEQPERVGQPVRVQIPAIGVDAKVVPVGLKPDDSMQVPDFGLAGWYTLGPAPGAPGPAVIVAHVDSYEGPDVFFRLHELSAGDEIRVIAQDGGRHSFVVSDVEQELKSDLPVDRIWNDTDEPVLRLVTCGGEFDRAARSYKSNVIVYASAKAP